MEEKLQVIKDWLSTGSINLFGLPMSGKDTQGMFLAQALGGKFLSSGAIIRMKEKEIRKSYTSDGDLLPTDLFREWVIPYFERQDLEDFPLILSSIGRWSGEEEPVMRAASRSGHPIKAAILLNISEDDVYNRWETARALGHRDSNLPESMIRRADDQARDVFEHRIKEFNQKTSPVLRYYHDQGLLIPVQADMSREEVYATLIDALYNFAQKSQKS